jgi:Holliday junction resolvasome RuvABC endonuclease subunit
MDPSLRNWGLAIGSYTPQTNTLVIEELGLTLPLIPTGKQTRQNSEDLEVARQLYRGAVLAAHKADAVFVEVPIGSQSARAMASYGICVGVLGALRSNGTPFFEVTPTEVKLAMGAGKTASKREMILKAIARHPQASWPRYMEHGVEKVSEAKAEHMADAVGAIYAGIQLPAFQQTLALLSAKQP